MSGRLYIGLGVTYHDPAIAIVAEDGRVLFAEATERCLQLKRSLNHPPDPVDRILALLAGYADGAREWTVAFNWRRRRPWYEPVSRWLGYFRPEGLIAPGYRDFSTCLEKYKLFHMLACQDASLPLGGVNLVRRVAEAFPGVRLRFRHFDHHRCHAAAACFGSPFPEAACLIVDSFGERGSVAAYRYRGGRLTCLDASTGLASLGFFYMMLTELCGFDWLAGEEWKVMGLAAYGDFDPELHRLMEPMLRVEGLRLRQDLGAVLRGLPQLRRRGRRPGSDPLTVADLAFTGQALFCRWMEQLAANLHRACGSDHLVLGGGCALNSSCNGRLLAGTPFRELYVPSAPADDGTALGAAWLAWQQDHPGAVPPPGPLTPYLGSDVDRASLNRLIRHGRLPASRHPHDLETVVAEELACGKVVAWMQGRAEFGPRALGNRSILADPRDPRMKQRLNAEIKGREGFRPFAPAILDRYGPDYFHDYQVSPYMERTLRFRRAAAARVPAVVHADGTGRVQSVRREWNPRFHRLVTEFHRLTGVPLVLNTSLNRMGKPMVHTVEDAVALFLTSGLDLLVIDDWLLRKPG